MGEVPGAAYKEAYDKVGQFFEKDPDGNYYFLDPVYGSRIRPGGVPKSILEDPTCARGFAFFVAFGPMVPVKLFLSDHAGVQSFRRLQNEAPKLNEVSICGLELAHTPLEGVRLAFDQSLVAPPVYGDYLPPFGEFQRATIDWLQQTGKIGIPSEIDNQFGVLYKRLDELAEYMGKLPEDDNVTKNIAFTAYQYSRQFAMPGRFGAWLDVLRKDAPHLFKQPIGYILGRWHEPVAGKMELFNVPVEVHRIGESDHYFKSAYIRATTNGYISAEDAALPTPL